jgi:hypothetical protein
MLEVTDSVQSVRKRPLEKRSLLQTSGKDGGLDLKRMEVALFDDRFGCRAECGREATRGHRRLPIAALAHATSMTPGPLSARSAALCTPSVPRRKAAAVGSSASVRTGSSSIRGSSTATHPSGRRARLHRRAAAKSARTPASARAVQSTKVRATRRRTAAPGGRAPTISASRRSAYASLGRRRDVGAFEQLGLGWTASHLQIHRRNCSRRNDAAEYVVALRARPSLSARGRRRL